MLIKLFGYSLILSGCVTVFACGIFGVISTFGVAVDLLGAILGIIVGLFMFPFVAALAPFYEIYRWGSYNLLLADAGVLGAIGLILVGIKALNWRRPADEKSARISG
jgi:ABC-type glycerol-3-phosphate transport system permease component